MNLEFKVVYKNKKYDVIYINFHDRTFGIEVLDEKRIDMDGVKYYKNLLLSLDDYELLQFTGKYDSNKIKIFDRDKIMWLCQGARIEGEVYWGDFRWKVRDLNGGNVTSLSNTSSILII